MSELITISKLCKILGLINPKTQKPLNHVLRYWEKEFLQIRPKKINNQRYYSKEDVEIVRYIHSLIKKDKISIAGVKKILNKNSKKLDVYHKDGLKIEYFQRRIKNKNLRLLKKLKELKANGKKDSS